MEDSRRLIEWWGKKGDRKARLKRRRIIWLSILGVIVVALILFGLYYFTDILSKPIKSVDSTSSQNSWAMYGRDLTHSGTPDSNGGVPQGNVKVLFDSGEIIHASPVAVNGVVYFGSRNGKFYAVEQNTGNKLWEFQTGSFVDSSAAVVNNVVYFGSNDGHLYALDARTGAKKWDFSTKFPVKSSPAVADGKVYFGADDYNFYAVHVTSGRQAWKVLAADTVPSSPAVSEGIVYFGSMDGKLYAVDANSGRVRLKFLANRPIIASPVVMDGTVYFNTSSGFLYAVEGKAKNWLWEHKIRPNWQILYLWGIAPTPPKPSGFLWSADLRGSTSSSPALGQGLVYLGIGNKLMAVDIGIASSSRDNPRRWEYSASGAFNSMPVAAGGNVYAGNENGHLYVLNGLTGELIKDVSLGGKITSAPAISNGAVFVTSEDGKLYMVD